MQSPVRPAPRTVPAPTDAPSRRAAAPRWFAPVLALVVIGGCGVRLVGLGTQEFWLDELHAMLNSAAHRARFEALPTGRILQHVPRFTELDADSTAARVWRGMRDDGHPPLYFVILHGWRRMLGDAEPVVRLTSALFSALSLLPVALVLREYGRPRTAIAAAVLLGVAFAHVHVAQQARPYSLATLIVATGYWLLVRMERRWASLSRGRRATHVAAYSATLCLAMLTHYFAGLAIAGQAAYALIRCRGSLLRWITCGALVAGLAFALIWLPSLVAQWDFIRAQDWVLDTAPDHARRTVIRAAVQPVRLLFPRPLPDWAGWEILLEGLTGVLVLLAAAVAVWRARAAESLPFLLWFTLPVAAFVVMDLATGIQLLSHSRYLSVAAPGMAGLLAVTLARLRRNVAIAFGAALAVLFALTIRLPATDNPHARHAARLLAARMAPGDLLVFDATGWIPYWPRRDFLLVSYYLPPLAADVLMLNRPPDPETLECVRTYDRIFCVSPRIDGLPNPTPQTHGRVERSEYIHDIGWVYLFQRGPPPASAPA